MSNMAEESDGRMNRIPAARVKTIMKADHEVKMIANDAVFAVTRATELFVSFLAAKVELQMKTSSRKTVKRSDIELVIPSYDKLMFLEGEDLTIPEENAKAFEDDETPKEAEEPANNNNA
eukprot:m.57422 g.57422  ORF g.57422 m.57422 type:complete len:120 (+) comp11107_c0_seq2:96-455(+)